MLRYTGECKTYGSGVVQPFNGSAYHVRTSCSVTLVHFTHQGVNCDVTAQRGPSGLLTRLEVVVNKVRTVVQNGTIMVENHRVSLPYDHTYQHVFHYGVHTRLRSKVLPLTITWHSSAMGITALWVRYTHSSAMGITALWVRLEGNSITGMKGLCGHLNTPAYPPQLISEAVLEDDTCVIEDSLEEMNLACGEFMSHAMSCLMSRAEGFFHLCQQNAYGRAASAHITCPFYWDVAQRCGPDSSLWYVWRDVTHCPAPDCPGELTYQELGNAFTPTCSNPAPRASDQDVTSTCVCPQGTVLNDRAEGHNCVSVTECPCVHGSSSYPPGTYRRTKCQTCECVSGKWLCSEDICPKRCSVESQFVTSFDGKHFRLPGKCSYVAAQGLNWTLTVYFSERAIKLETVELKIYHESYVFSHSRVMFQNEEIRDLHQTAFVSVFWQSSMFVQVLALSGLSIQVQMSPDMQLYVSLPTQHNGTTTGLCGNFNGDSGDDFTTSSGIVENSAEPFALSWSLESCEANINPLCINMDTEIFADEHCDQLRDPHGIFSSCHSHVPYERYHQACLSTTCHCQSGLQACLCVALGNYAKTCAAVGAPVGEWRTAANCSSCPNTPSRMWS
ncbi:mucin-6-like, partial [Sardina pilchardus]|uniref:mucin-6-like n=1 Tax=Sardina pilchardus TaxID=27697 RepID=UPI002E101912